MSSLRHILIIIFALGSIASPAQPYDIRYERCDVELNKPYLKSYLTDSWNILKSPVRWRARQWAIAGAVSGATILAYTQDDVIRDFFQRNRTHPADKSVQYFFEPLGKGIVALSIGAGFYAVGEISGQPGAKRAGLTAVKAIALTSVVTYAIKYATQRHDPHDNTPPDPRIWEGPSGSYRNTSFPSGHSSVVFALAAVIASEYNERIWVPAIVYSLASMVAISRVYEDEHWASDVIFGSALGFFTGKFVYQSTVKCPQLVMIPGVSAGGHPGFLMVYQLR